MLKEDPMETFNVYFGWEKEHMAFFFLGWDMSLMDMFKVVCDDQILDDANDSSLVELIISPLKDAQVEPEGDKAVEYINLGKSTKVTL